MTAVLVLYLGEVLVYADDVSLLGPSTTGHRALEGKEKYKFQVKDIDSSYRWGLQWATVPSNTNTQHTVEGV